jgi:hypothetical protein
MTVFELFKVLRNEPFTDFHSYSITKEQILERPKNFLQKPIMYWNVIELPAFPFHFLVYMAFLLEKREEKAISAVLFQDTYYFVQLLIFGIKIML